MFRLFVLVIALATTWIVWSGNFKPLLLALGVISVALTLLISHRMRLTRREFFTLDLIPRMLAYWGWLLLEIVKSNFTVAKIILSPRLPIAPTLITIKNPCAGFIGQATLANSITLTPGTLTVDAHEGEFRIHCLTMKAADDVVSGDMDGRVLKALGAH